MKNDTLVSTSGFLSPAQGFTPQDTIPTITYSSSSFFATTPPPESPYKNVQYKLVGKS